MPAALTSCGNITASVADASEKDTRNNPDDANDTGRV